MKKKKRSEVGWYHVSSTDGFGGIFYCEKSNDCPNSMWSTPHGPFKTFGEAKADAVEYYKTDIREAKRHIMHVQSFKKGQAND